MTSAAFPLLHTCHFYSDCKLFRARYEFSSCPNSAPALAWEYCSYLERKIMGSSLKTQQNPWKCCEPSGDMWGERGDFPWDPAFHRTGQDDPPMAHPTANGEPLPSFFSPHFTHNGGCPCTSPKPSTCSVCLSMPRCLPVLQSHHVSQTTPQSCCSSSGFLAIWWASPPSAAITMLPNFPSASSHPPPGPGLLHLSRSALQRPFSAALYYLVLPCLFPRKDVSQHGKS